MVRIVTQTELESELTTGLATKANQAALDALEASVSASSVAAIARNNGAAILEPVRVPTFTVDKEFPNGRVLFRPVWVDGDTVYAVGYDKSLYKSTDGGDTWTLKSTARMPAHVSNGCFVKTPAGTLVMVGSAAPPVIYRSTDDGATWSTARHTLRASTIAMAPQSLDVDQTTGYVYYGEYQTTDAFAEIRVVRSTDEGDTWSTFHAFNGPSSGAADRVRHVHSVQYDPVSARMYVMTGDTEAAAGIYRVNAGGTALEAVATNGDLAAVGSYAARAIALMFFPDHIAWLSDNPTLPYLYRLTRASIGGTLNAEQVYRVSGSGWFTQKAATDGTQWICTASNESGGRLDTSTHVYAVDNDGARIWELAAVSSEGVAIAAIAPVGSTVKGGDVFWLRGHGYSRDFAYKARLAKGFVGLRKPTPPSKWKGLQSQSSGLVTVDPSTARVFGHTKCTAVQARTLYIYDIGARKDSGAGTFRVQVTNTAGTVLGAMDSSFESARMGQLRDDAEAIAEIVCAANDTILFRVRELGGAGTSTGSAFVVFGWGYE